MYGFHASCLLSGVLTKLALSLESFVGAFTQIEHCSIFPHVSLLKQVLDMFWLILPLPILCYKAEVCCVLAQTCPYRRSKFFLQGAAGRIAVVNKCVLLICSVLAWFCLYCNPSLSSNTDKNSKAFQFIGTLLNQQLHGPWHRFPICFSHRAEWPKDHFIPPYVPRFRNDWEPPLLNFMGAPKEQELNHLAESVANVAEQQRKQEMKRLSSKVSSCKSVLLISWGQHQPLPPWGQYSGTCLEKPCSGTCSVGVSSLHSALELQETKYLFSRQKCN